MATSDLPTDPHEYNRWYQDRKPDPRAEAEQFEAWMEEQGLSENQLHKIIGRPRSYIQQRRALLHACPEVIVAWQGKRITWSVVREICAGAPDQADAQRATLAMILKRPKGKRTLDATAIRMFARGAASQQSDSPQG